jgi:hypothetical protein
MRHPEKYQDEDDEFTAEEMAEELEMLHQARAAEVAASEAVGDGGGAEIGDAAASAARPSTPAAPDRPEIDTISKARRGQPSAMANAGSPLPNGKNGGSGRAAKSAAGPAPLRTAG